MIGLLWKAKARTLLAWPLGLLAVCWATARAITQFYSTPQERLAYAQALEVAPFSKAISGSGSGLDSLGGVLANEFAILLFNGVAVAAILLSVGLTRKEEDLGRTELITASPISKLSPLTSAMVTVASSFAILTLGLGAVLSYYDHINWLYLAAVAAYALIFAGVGFVCAELFGDTRTAIITGLGLYFLCYFARIAVIATESPLWWTNPLGWFDHTEPFTAKRLLPLVISIAVAVGLHLTALFLRSQRDLGTGVVSFSRSTRGSHLFLAALPLRLNLTLITSWCIVGIAFGALLGSMLDQWVDVLTLNLDSVEAFGFSGSADSISQMVGLLGTTFSAAVGIGVLSTARREETSTRMAYLLSTPTSRTKYWAQWIAIAIATTVIINIATTGAYVLTGAVADTFIPLQSYLLPALFLVGCAAAMHVYFGWILYAFSVIMAFFADTMNISNTDLFPINSIGKVPVTELNTTAAWSLAVVALILTSLSFVRFNTRALAG